MKVKLKHSYGDIFLLSHRDEWKEEYHLCQIVGVNTDPRHVMLNKFYEYEYWDETFGDYIVGWKSDKEIDEGKELLEKYMKEN